MTLMNVLSFSTVSIGLALAWATYALEARSSLSVGKQRKISLLTAIKTELENMKPWAGSPYPRDKDYAVDPRYRDWKDPVAKLVFPFVHNAVQLGAKEGMDRGLSLDFARKLVELEQSIAVFEQALSFYAAPFVQDPKVLFGLGKKLRDGEKQFTEEEGAAMYMAFWRNYHLHVNCIGEEGRGRNLHTSYLRVIRSIESELNCTNTEAQWKTPRWHWVLHVFALGFLGVGVTYLVWFIANPLTFKGTP